MATAQQNGVSKPFVFISYARRDKRHVSWVTQNLLAAGHKVFIDQEMPAASRWEAILADKIATCSALVVVWSVASIRSEWVVKEVAEALRLNKVVVPIRIQNVAPPPAFAHLNVADLRQWQGNFGDVEWQKVLTELAGDAARPTLSPAVIKAHMRNGLAASPNQRLDVEGDTLVVRAPTEEKFREHVRTLQRQGYVVQSLSEDLGVLEKRRRFHWPLAIVLGLAAFIPLLVYLRYYRNSPERLVARVVRLS